MKSEVSHEIQCDKCIVKSQMQNEFSVSDKLA